MALGGGRSDLESALERVEDALAEGDIRRARRELRRAKRAFPGSIEVLEWEATILREQERPDDALRVLERILEREPARAWALLEKPSVLVDLGRFEEARPLLEAAVRGDVPDASPEELARAHYELGLCLDRAGEAADADREFREAERLAPDSYPAPARLSADDFDALVASAVEAIPPEFAEHLKQVSLVVQDYPDPKDDPFLLGLYAGTPRTEASLDPGGTLDRIFLFKRNHELLVDSEDELREEVRKTIVHELAHHFGLEEKDMGYYA